MYVCVRVTEKEKERERDVTVEIWGLNQSCFPSERTFTSFWWDQGCAIDMGPIP